MSHFVSSKMVSSRKGSGQKETLTQDIIFCLRFVSGIVGIPLAILYLLFLLFAPAERRGGWICESRDGLVARRNSHGKGALKVFYLDGDRVSYSEHKMCTWTQVPHTLRKGD